MERRRLRPFLDDADFAERERVALLQVGQRRHRIFVREDLAPTRIDCRLADREELRVANPEMGLRDRGDARGRQRREESGAMRSYTQDRSPARRFAGAAVGWRGG